VIGASERGVNAFIHVQFVRCHLGQTEARREAYRLPLEFDVLGGEAGADTLRDLLCHLQIGLGQRHDELFTAKAGGNVTRPQETLQRSSDTHEHGIAAVALHDIGAAAGQRNNAAVQYHFGDRDTLIREITTYRAAASEDTRAAAAATSAAGSWMRRPPATLS